MAKYRITSPDGETYEITAPDGATEQQVMEYAQQQFSKPAEQRVDPSIFPLPVGQAGFGQAMQETLAEASPGAKRLAAFGSGARNLYEGGKQMLGMGDPQAVQAMKQIRQSAPATAFAGDVASFVPTAAIPGVNTLKGAAMLGGAYGGLQPTDSMKQRGTNAAFGAAGGVAGQYVGGKIGQKASSMLADRTARKAAERAQNTVVDQTLNEAHRAGYVFPPTAMNKNSFLEGISGQFKTQQEAAWRNQQVTNNLMRKDLGLKPNEPVTKQAFQKFFKEQGKAYDDVARINNQAAIELEALKTVRHEAKLHFDHYSRTADPEALLKGQALRQTADGLEKSLESHAMNAGKPELVNNLRKARTNMAKGYTYEDAVRFSTGDVNAGNIAKDYTAGMRGEGPRLTGNLERIGKVAEARPESMRMRGFSPNPTSALDTMAATVAAGASGGTPGLLAAGVPLLRGPVRNYLLSPSVQNALRPKPSDYAVGLTPQLVEKLMTNQLMQRTFPGMGAGLLGD